MNLENIQTIDELFALWQKERGYTSFSNDGILVEDLWKTANPKIAFLLKESNDNFANIRGHCWPKDGERGNSCVFWPNLRMWTYVTTELLNGRQCTFDETMVQRAKPLCEVAYINIKKNDECQPISADSDIQEYLNKDFDYLTRQIEIINPDVLFCGGTFKYLKENQVAKAGLKQVGTRIFSFKNMLVVDFYHPSAWRPGYESKFRLLSEILQSMVSDYNRLKPINTQK